MIAQIKDEIKAILKTMMPETNITIGDFENWSETGSPASLVEWVRTHSVQRTINTNATVVYIELYYSEAVPKDRNKEPYLNNLEELVNKLFISNNFGNKMVSLNIDANKIDRTLDNNDNFISRISISGQYHL